MHFDKVNTLIRIMIGHRTGGRRTCPYAVRIARTHTQYGSRRAPSAARRGAALLLYGLDLRLRFASLARLHLPHRPPDSTRFGHPLVEHTLYTNPPAFLFCPHARSRTGWNLDMLAERAAETTITPGPAYRAAAWE